LNPSPQIIVLDAGGHPPGDSLESSATRGELHRRWQALLTNEAAYRTAPAQQAAAN